MTTQEAKERIATAARSARLGTDEVALAAQDAAESAAEAIPEALGRLRDSVGDVAGRLPEAIGSARSGALATADSLRAMPQPTLQVMAALSVGMGLGLYIAGAPRLVTILAFTPALLAGLVVTIDQSRSPATKD